jgi:hypothetical protein
MVGSVFRLVNIDRDQDGILIIHMKLCSLNDHHLKSLFQHMQKKYTNKETNLLDLGVKLDDAEKYYHRFFHELPYNHIHAVQCYDQLGNIARKKGYYEWSLKWHNQSLSIKKQTLKLGHHSIVYSHSNIGDL